MDFSQEQYDRINKLSDLLEAVEGGKQMPLVAGIKNTPTTVGGVAPYATGVGGLFSTPGQEPTIFSSIMAPLQGVMNALPINPQGAAAPDDPAYGGYDSPLYTTVTGVTAGDGDAFANQPTDPCDDAPVGGLLKACTLTAPFGRFSMKTRQLDITAVGRLTHRGEPTNLQLMNGIFPRETLQTPSLVPNGGSPVLQHELQQRLMESGVSMQRLMAFQTYTGNPTNNTAGGGGKQFMGLDLLINAGNKVDAITGIACPSMDSDIKDFGFDKVNGSGRDIVDYVDMLYYFLTTIADDTGLSPVTWGIAMRPNMFDEIVKVWPIRYYQEGLAQMANFTGGRVNLSGSETTDFRDRMRGGRYLMIRGEQIPVLLDNSIAELTNVTSGSVAAGQYASDIYFVPMTVLGGIQVTWWEYFNQANQNAQAIQNLTAGQTWTTDNGMFRWHFNHKNGCLEWTFVVQPRLVLRTPFLAGRIQNVLIEPLQHTRDWAPTQPYFTNGGRTNAPIDQYYTEWSTSTPVQVG